MPQWYDSLIAKIESAEKIRGFGPRTCQALAAEVYLENMMHDDNPAVKEWIPSIDWAIWFLKNKMVPPFVPRRPTAKDYTPSSLEEMARLHERNLDVLVDLMVNQGLQKCNIVMSEYGVHLFPDTDNWARVGTKRVYSDGHGDKRQVTQNMFHTPEDEGKLVRLEVKES